MKLGRPAKYIKLRKLAERNGISLEAMLRWYKPEMSKLAFKCFVNETKRV